MSKYEYKNYKCTVCGTVKRAWIESICYKEKLCPKCIDKKVEVTDTFKWDERY